MTYFSAYYDSPLGRIMLGAQGEKLVGLWLEGQKYFADTVDGEFVENPDLPILSSAAKWLDAYFAGKKPVISSLALAPQGSAFRQQVWRILCDIPYGQYLSYGEIARKIAARTGRKSMSGRAVGGAVGHNPISIIIPCHRVVGSGGSLTGYSGGIRKKIKLLELEGVDMSGFFIPGTGTAL
uniref:methylated-DNA--[protein]-cysteine S-methyltransferase n=1 Tax=Castellaniella defragrans TaxID=75697 RepID=UPI0033410B74